MGPSGSGKSTLLHCLAGILVPDSGEIHFDGRRIDTLRRDRAQRAAPGPVRVRVPVRPARAGADRRGERRAAAAAQRRRPGRGAGAARRLVRPARPGRAGAAPSGELSGGQAQRVALARGLVAARRCCSPTSRPVARLAHRRAGHGPAGRRRPRAGHHRRAGHPRGRGSPPTPTARSSSATARSRSTAGRVARMIRLGLRLALAGGREAVARLVVIAAAVALGVGLLLTTLAGINAVNAQNARYAWLDDRPDRHRPRPRRRAGAGPALVAAAAPTTSTGQTDRPGRRRRHRARTRRSRRASRAARAGEYYASPALASCCAPPRPPSSATASPGARSARSARRRCPRRTR